jgi:hypothetical protein
MNVVKYLYNNKFITTVDDKVIKKLNDFEKITSVKIKNTSFGLFQAIKILSDFDPGCDKMVIQYLINIEKITLNLFVFSPVELKKEIIQTLANDTNHIAKNLIVSKKILNTINTLEKDPNVIYYNKSLYDIRCITCDKITELLIEHKDTLKDSYIPIIKTAYKSTYSFILHKLILLLLKVKVIKNNIKFNHMTVISYGEIATILYALYFPVIQIKSYVGKIFYNTFQSFLIKIGFLDYFCDKLKPFRNKIKLVAEFIICSGHINDNQKFICDEEFSLENIDKRALIVCALYDGKAAGRDFWHHLHK